MQTITLENQILSKLRELKQEDQVQFLDYLKMRAPKRHITSKYKRRALKQIREALTEKA